MDNKSDVAVGVEEKEPRPLTQKQFMKVMCTGSDGKPIPKIHIYGTQEGREDLMDNVPEGTKVNTMFPIVDGARKFQNTAQP